MPSLLHFVYKIDQSKMCVPIQSDASKVIFHIAMIRCTILCDVTFGCIQYLARSHVCFIGTSSRQFSDPIRDIRFLQKVYPRHRGCYLGVFGLPVVLKILPYLLFLLRHIHLHVVLLCHGGGDRLTLSLPSITDLRLYPDF